MSKHGNYNKYSKYNYNPKNDTVEEKIEVEADIEVDVDECAACDPVVEETVEEPAAVEEPEIEVNKNEPLVGVTTTRLNIRSNPAVTTDNVVAVVNEGTVVMIDYLTPNGDWFKVYTEAGIEGYCMKKFVKLSN